MRRSMAVIAMAGLLALVGCADGSDPGATESPATAVSGQEAPDLSDQAATSLPVGSLRELFIASDSVVSGELGSVVVADTGQRGSEGERLVILSVSTAWRGERTDVLLALSDLEFRDAVTPGAVLFLRRVRDPRGFLEYRGDFGDVWLLTPGPNSVLIPSGAGVWSPADPMATIDEASSLELTATADDTRDIPTFEFDSGNDGSVVDDESSRSLDGACGEVRTAVGALLQDASQALDGSGELPTVKDMSAAFERATPFLRDVADSLVATRPNDVRLSQALDSWFLADTLAHELDGGPQVWRAMIAAVADFQLALVGVIAVNCKSFV